MTHFLSALWQKALGAAVGAVAGSLVTYVRLRAVMLAKAAETKALVLLKHEEMKLHVTHEVEALKEGHP